LQGVAPHGLVVVVVRVQVFGRVFPLAVVVAVATCCRAAVVVVIVVVRGKMMTHIWIRFLGPILDPGQTQGYV